MRICLTYLCSWLLLPAFCHGQTLAEHTNPRPDETQRIPVGSLGYPLGSYLVIEGVPATKESAGLMGYGQILIVDRVSSHSLNPPVQIDLAMRLPAGKRCIFKGYETGGWEGYPPPEVEKSGEYNKNGITQGLWSFHNRFVIVKVVLPHDFKTAYTSFGN